MNDALQKPYSYYKAYSSVKRPFNKKTVNYNRYFNKRVNTVKGTRVNTARPKAEVNTVKASASWVWKPKHEDLDHISKSNSASKTLARYDYVDTLGRFNSEGQEKTYYCLDQEKPDLWIVVLRIGKLQGIGEFLVVGFILTQQMVINSPCLTASALTSPKQIALELAIPGQTATGKESSNPFMAGSLPKTIHLCDSLQSDDDSFELIELMILCTNFLTMGRIDDNKISNSKVEDDKETALEVKKCLDTSSW
ncbi:hypothetical protein Tco_0309733 [Tanacetum coccineum]